MPLYYFDVRDQDGVEFDDVGIDLPNVQAARNEARRALGEMIKEQIRKHPTAAITIDIRSGDGEFIVEVVAASDDRDRRSN